MAKHRGAGFQKPSAPTTTPKAVKVAVIHFDRDAYIPTASCSCGAWAASHTRQKVLDDKIDRHLSKHHNGRGLRL